MCYTWLVVLITATVGESYTPSVPVWSMCVRITVTGFPLNIALRNVWESQEREGNPTLSVDKANLKRVLIKRSNPRFTTTIRCNMWQRVFITIPELLWQNPVRIHFLSEAVLYISSQKRAHVCNPVNRSIQYFAPRKKFDIRYLTCHERQFGIHCFKIHLLQTRHTNLSQSAMVGGGGLINFKFITATQTSRKNGFMTNSIL